MNKRNFQIGNEKIILYPEMQSQIDVRRAIGEILQENLSNLPQQQNAHIVIKPNLNNDLSALTGNSTDLRVLLSVLEGLQQHGYANITIADGPNVGVFRKAVDVFGRLGVRQLAEKFGVNLVDLNQSPYVEVETVSGTVRVAEICLNADFLINIPKIKTHAEAGMSLAVKNLMGCVVGTDTRIMHQDLGSNLIRLNQVIKPDLVIVDGLIGMEGNGPGDGEPRKLDLILAGRDAFIVDLLVAQLMNLDRDSISYLRIAKEEGRFSDPDLELIDQIEALVHLNEPPKRNPLSEILEHRSLGKVRDLTRFIHGTVWARKLLYRLGIMQDVYEDANAHIEHLELDFDLCDDCGRCLEICPTELSITKPGFDFYASPDCLNCLYCALICPQEAIRIDGELGYLEAHISRYGGAIRSL
jgi:uncharacterized protein (DUF362 family)/ferredoxin